MTLRRRDVTAVMTVSALTLGAVDSFAIAHAGGGEFVSRAADIAFGLLGAAPVETVADAAAPAPAPVETIGGVDITPPTPGDAAPVTP